MIEFTVHELDTTQLLIVASLLVVILLAAMFDRHLEEKRDRDTMDRVDKSIDID